MNNKTGYILADEIFFNKRIKKYITEKSTGKANFKGSGLSKPIIAKTVSVNSTDKKKKEKFFKELYNFFISSDNSKLNAYLPSEDITIPLYKHQKKSEEYIRKLYPFYFGKDIDNKEFLCYPLFEWLDESFKLFSKTTKVKYLNDFLHVFEFVIATIIQNNNNADLKNILNKSVKKLFDFIEIPKEIKDVLIKELNSFSSFLNNYQGNLFPFSNHLPLILLKVITKELNNTKKEQLLEKINKVLYQLEETVLLEEKKELKKLKESFGKQQWINVDELKELLPEQQTVEHINKEKLNEIKHIIALLKKDKEKIVNHKNSFFVSKYHKDFVQNILSNGDFEIKNLILKEVFSEQDEIRKRYTEIFKHIKLGNLFIDDKFTFENKQLIENIQWSMLDPDDLQLFPSIYILFSNDFAKDSDLKQLLIQTQIPAPLKIISLNNSISTFKNADNTNGEDDMIYSFLSYRKLNYFQISLSNPVYLADSLYKGLNSLYACLFNIYLPKINNNLDYLEIIQYASLTSRVFPHFSYFIKEGNRYGSRIKINNNPQYENDWPEYELECKNEEKLVLKLTPADLLFFSNFNNVRKKHFVTVPYSFSNSELLMYIGDYINANSDEKKGKIPFIWGINTKNELIKIALDYSIIIHCIHVKERWNFLQEIAGVHNYFVEKALNEKGKELEREFENKKQVLEQEYNDKIEEIKRKSTEETLNNLANAILELDINALTGQITPSSRGTTPSVSISTEPEPITELESKEYEEKLEEVKEEELTEEPWIDSAKCTSCNECIDLNGNMFKYNDNKQAYLADPTAGTYAELVQAAEQCPARCIHPGMPINKNEANLEDLIERAKKFI